MKKIKHSKFKNTGFIFELLVRQVTAEIMSSNKSVTEKILKEYFNSKKELSKELKLYQYLINEKYNSEAKAEKFIDTILEARKRLDEKKIVKEKYNLIKSIKETYNLDEFIKSPISNYKVLASIYKVFESKVNNGYDIKDVFNSKITLIENITSKPVSQNNKPDAESAKLLEMYKKQDKDIRLLTYKILVESFNKKYTHLDTTQKSILREYINNVNNTSKFKDFFVKELNKTILELKSINNKVCDVITNIKLKETISVLKSQKIGKTISDNQVSVLLLSQELLKELKTKVK